MHNLILLFSILLACQGGQATLKIMTTTANLKSLVIEVTGDRATVDSMAKGTQDPHYLEAKPSFMVKASKADLLVSVGLDLEIGWLPLIVRGARNPKINSGAQGSFVAGDFIDPIETVSGDIDRAHGDVHPAGNPHFMLDPLNAIRVAAALKTKLIEIDPSNKTNYETNFNRFESKLRKKVNTWKNTNLKHRTVISYHKTLNYFYKRFGINNIDYLEPKPGIPPSISHVLKVIKKTKKNGVSLIIVENYFDPSVAQKVARDLEGIKVIRLPVSVDGDSSIKNLFDLYERMITTFEGDS